MKRFIILLLSLILLTGCTRQQETLLLPPSEPTATPILPVTNEANTNEEIAFDFISVSVPAVNESVQLEDGSALFSYLSQHIQIMHPDADLTDRITLDFLNRVDKVMPEAQNALASAQEQYNPDLPWYPYFYNILYNPTRIDNDVLSLAGTQSSFIGGMHSNIFAVSANYDMMTGDVLTLGSIMHENAGKEEFINIILDKLEKQKEDLYLFDDYADAVYSRFKVDTHLYEDFFFTTTGLNFYFSPYEIAPYTSGVITVEIPYEELPGLIYDGYFPAEREQIQGNLHWKRMDEMDMTQFDNMVEVMLSETDSPLVVYPEGAVEDIKITIAGDGRNIQSYTVFAAPKMNDSNAIVIYATDEVIQNISVHYYSGNAYEQLNIA